MFTEAVNRTNGSMTRAASDAINLVIVRANDNHVGMPRHPIFTIAMTLQTYDEGVIMERKMKIVF